MNSFLDLDVRMGKPSMSKGCRATQSNYLCNVRGKCGWSGETQIFRRLIIKRRPAFQGVTKIDRITWDNMYNMGTL